MTDNNRFEIPRAIGNIKAVISCLDYAESNEMVLIEGLQIVLKEALEIVSKTLKYSLKEEIMRAFEDGKRCGAYKINELPEEYADNRIKELEALND